MKILVGLLLVSFLLTKNGLFRLKPKLGLLSSLISSKKRKLIGVAIREGFNLAIETIQTFASRKIEIQSNINLLNPDCLKIIFSGACSIEPT
jgi:hypothetical protein